jgi:hypothetical protein
MVDEITAEEANLLLPPDHKRERSRWLETNSERERQFAKIAAECQRGYSWQGVGGGAGIPEVAPDFDMDAFITEYQE